MPSTAADPLLLPRVVRGDPAAIDGCIERFGQVAWSLARELARDTTDAEDAAQEIFLDLWKSADGFDPTLVTEAAFVAEVARRRLVDRRYRDRWHPMLEPPPDEPGDVAATLADVLAGVLGTIEPLPESLALRIAEDARVHFGRPILSNALVVPARVTITERPPRPSTPAPDIVSLPALRPAPLPTSPQHAAPMRPAPLPIAPLWLSHPRPEPTPPNPTRDIVRGAAIGIAAAGWALALWTMLSPPDAPAELPSAAAIAAASPASPGATSPDSSATTLPQGSATTSLPGSAAPSLPGSATTSLPGSAAPSTAQAGANRSAVAPHQQRTALLAEPDAVTLVWAASQDPAAVTATGDVVWSDAQQRGILRFRGLARNDPTALQYQLWIFDPARDARYPVDGGVFDVSPREADRDTGDVLIPIAPRLPVRAPTQFLITAENPGGTVVSTRQRPVLTTLPKD